MFNMFFLITQRRCQALDEKSFCHVKMILSSCLCQHLESTWNECFLNTLRMFFKVARNAGVRAKTLEIRWPSKQLFQYVLFHSNRQALCGLSNVRQRTAASVLINNVTILWRWNDILGSSTKRWSRSENNSRINLRKTVGDEITGQLAILLANRTQPQEG